MYSDSIPAETFCSSLFHKAASFTAAMAYQQAAQAYEAAPGVEEAEAPAAQVYEAPPEVAQPEPAAAVEQLAAAGNNKRKAEEHGVSEEEHMRKRASFNGPADPEPANGVRAAPLLAFMCLTCYNS